MEEVETSSWNKKRIAIVLLALVFTVFIGYEIKSKVLGKNLDFLSKGNLSANNLLKSVKGESEKEDNGAKNSNAQSVPNVQTILEQRLEIIKKEVESLNVSEIASSTPQVQKILNDISALKEYPSNQAKEACLKICNGL